MVDAADAERAAANEPPPEPDAAPRRTTTERGQPLVEVPPAKRRRRAARATPPPETREYRSLEDVVEKYRPPAVHTPDDAVPPEEPDPARRERATYGTIELTPEAYDPDEPLPAEFRNARPHSRDDEPPEPDADKLRTLEDLCARFDLDGTGQFYIMVTRQQPRAWAGTATYGRMRNIETGMSHEEFCLAYGGGQYMLVVYGPPKRGSIIDPITRLPKKRALSKPVMLTIPWEGENGLPPNPMAALDPYEGSDSGTVPRVGGGVTETLINRRVNTLADAKIIETQTQKELTMDERERQARREDQQQRRRDEAAAVEVLKESKDETIRMQQQRIDALEKEARANATKSNGGSEVAHAMAQVVSAFQRPQGNSDELQRMKDGYEERLDSQRDGYEARLKDLAERHKRELEDRERVLLRDKEDGVRRAEEQARLAQQHLEQSSRQLIMDRDREREDAKKEIERIKADHQREIELMKREQERDLNRQKEQYENLLRAEKESNERERRTTEQLTTTKAELTKATVESELRTATAEVTRLRADNERLKAEVDKRSNLPKQLKEFSDAAESLGFARDEGGGGKEEPATWQEILMKGGLQAVEKLPEILKHAGELMQMRQNAARSVQAPAARPPMGPPVMLPPGARPGAPAMQPVTQSAPLSGWATEDSPHNPTPLSEFYEPALPAAAGPERPAAMPTPADIALAPPPVAAPPPSAPAPAPVPRPVPAARSVAPPPTAPPAAPPVQVSDADILQFVAVVEEWLGKPETSPEDWARGAAMQLPVLKVVAPALTPEHVAAVLRKHGKGLSPLVRRDGQRFLARFRAALLKEAERERSPTA